LRGDVPFSLSYLAREQDFEAGLALRVGVHWLIGENQSRAGYDNFAYPSDECSGAMSVSGAIFIILLLKAHLRRIDRDDKGFPLRLYPFTRLDEADQPKNIVIDPFISFGKAVITGTGISTRHCC